MKAKRTLKVKEPINPQLKKLTGIIRLPDNFNEENELRANLEKKHLDGINSIREYKKA